MRTRVDTLSKMVNKGQLGRTPDLHLVERFVILKFAETFAKGRCISSRTP